jgi:peroxiredoxin Q/BCP
MAVSLLAEGVKAPQFSAKDQDGKTVTLEEYRGKKVVLYFYPKDDTPGCTKEACAFRDNLPNFTSLHVDVLGVSVDTESKHKKFAEKFQLPFRLVSDPDKTIVEAYGVWGLKKFMGREYMGTSRVTYLINEDGVIEKVWPKVKPDDHAEELLNYLQQKI